ncbi:hypothetical protein A2765_00470 [Candidatus Kaiserbacteria bacterium RIFCSPHIGHO2_01_FULL_56_24]|uniref:Glycosyl transferase family 1 domain-containing protein n=1 Tax=Candidatus Kaiserbacteria bacterium RIFCSPHIGHO2_01_FULL_56_24 TaxID=1798487 RepID=A0A1F6DBV8_9BACT|nr:MAG: hypothetical protein A2765_00470 [Candidatus Kaiserbacteria bacterium RIFCSPHIGHO2_01_FULL_56_24]
MNAIDVRGGSTRFVTDLAENLRAAGHTVEVLVRNGSVIPFIWKVHVRARTSDIVQVTDMKPLGIIAYLATRFTKAKYVIVGQGSYAVAPLDNPKTSLIARRVYRAAGAVVAISSFIKREIDGRMKGARVVVINHGVDLTKFHGALAAPKSGVPYVLGVGSIKHRKGYDTALRAFIRAKKDVPDLRYVIVGAHIDEPKYVQKLMETVRESRVEDSVDFVKDISDERLRELYQGASLFMLTSVNAGGHFEGFGLVFLEAAAYGLASIGTKGNGIEDAIIDGKTGVLVPQYDVEATAAAIVRLMQDDQLRKQLGTGARRHAEARTWPIVVREYEELYKDILARK